ncbi:MAG TPA: CaiB/BaiF CoA-transferase family protein, partial [Hyphomicrobiaceae bacterium]|nr:CaiB/BaiF CoA-transferase family protein [Hyphomicrobiaceae bacterium]
KADFLLENFRPGTMEKWGCGYEDLAKINPRLIMIRVSGFGQTGPMAPRAGHDINYIALAGVLGAVGRKGAPPTMPLNLVGDFGGGGMLLAVGVLAALLEASRSGKGQVVDAAMVDGAALLMAGIHGLYSQGTWKDERGVNILDTGAPWYEVYETSDGKWVSIGSIEGRFYEDLLARLGLAGEKLPKQWDKSGWPMLRERFAAAFKTKSRDAWCQVFEGSDACFAPVLTMAEVEAHPHNRERKTFLRVDGVMQAAPAPRFSRTAAKAGAASRGVGTDTDAVLGAAGFAPERIKDLIARGVVGTAKS